MRLYVQKAPRRRLSPAPSYLKPEMKQVTVSAIHLLHTAPRSLQLMWRHITEEAPEHILHFSSFFCSYQATWSHKGRGKTGARERTCVGRGERCVKIKGCRQSKAMCMIVLTQYPPPPNSKSSPLPSGSKEESPCARKGLNNLWGRVRFMVKRQHKTWKLFTTSSQIYKNVILTKVV